MKKFILITLLFFFLPGITHAQENSISNKFGIGFQLAQYQKDFGFGLNITSPYFAKNKFALRTRINLMYNQNTQNNETAWSPYSNVSLGLVGVSGKIGKSIRLYGEGGFIGLFPSKEFSSDNFLLGGYGLFGFEFYMSSNNNYFIEIGGIGTGAIADKIENKPIYSNGLLISTGFRIQF